MTLNDIQVAGVMIAQNRKEQVIPNVKAVYPYVDYFVIVDGGSTDGLQEELKKLDVDNKINIIDFPWCDNFPLSRTQYITNAWDLRDPNKYLWLCRFDSDEFLSEDFLKKMRTLILWAEQQGYDGLRIRSLDVELDREGNEIKSNFADWWKMLVYKCYEGLTYLAPNAGRVHETYNHGFRAPQIPSEGKADPEAVYCYRHVKTQGDIWERAQRNFYIIGGGDNLGEISEPWVEFRKVLREIFEKDLDTYHDYINYIKEGNVDQRLIDFWVKYAFEGELNRDFDKYPKSKTEVHFETHPHMNGSGNVGLNYPGSSEVREGLKFYYDWLHPNEVIHLPREFVMDSPLEQATKDYFEQLKAETENVD